MPTTISEESGAEDLPEDCVMAQNEWEYSDDPEEAILIKVDGSSWQLGLNGEDAPRTVHFIDGTRNVAPQPTEIWDSAFCEDKARALVESFIERECECEAPRYCLFVMAPHTYMATGAGETWSHFATEVIGFKGFLTTDCRHMCLYASGRHSGLVMDVSPERVGVLALLDGYLITEATHSLPLDLGSNANDLDSCTSQVKALVTRVLDNAPVDAKAELAGNVYLAGGGLFSLVQAHGREKLVGTQ